MEPNMMAKLQINTQQITKSNCLYLLIPMLLKDRFRYNIDSIYFLSILRSNQPNH